MRCTSCPLLSEEGGAWPIAHFLKEIANCDECPEVAAGAPALQAAHHRLLQSARLLHKTESKLRQRETELSQAQASATQFEARIENMERLYQQSARELEPQLAVVERQAVAIRALSAPVLEVGDGLLAMPVLGVLDAERAEHLTMTLLNSTQQRKARVAILDLTGLAEADRLTASLVLRLCRSVQLLGAQIVLCGIGMHVAQQLVALGGDLSTIPTVPTLRSALSFAQKLS